MLIRSLLDVQMHSIARVTLITLLGFTVSIAQAQDADDSIGRDDTPFYSGTAFISVDPDLDNLDSAFGLAQTIGIRIPGISWIGFELDLGFTLFGGENDGGRTIPAGGDDCPALQNPFGCEQPGSTASNDDFQAITYGLYTAFRTPGRLYAGTRLGFGGMNTNIEELEEDSDGFVYTLQAGYRWSKATHNMVQLEYLEFQNDAKYISISAFYAFDAF